MMNAPVAFMRRSPVLQAALVSAVWRTRSLVSSLELGSVRADWGALVLGWKNCQCPGMVRRVVEE